MKFILCPNITNTTRTSSGELLSHWFDYSCRPMTAGIFLTNDISSDARLLPERTLKEQIYLSGEPLTISDLYTCLFLELKNGFPTFKINEDFKRQQFVIYVNTQPTLSEEIKFKKAFETLQTPWGYRIEVESKIENGVAPSGSTNEFLFHSRRLRNSISMKLLSFLESDEDFWVDNRLKLLEESSSLLPETLITEWKSPKSKCLIHPGLGQPINIRSCISIYRKIYLIFPTTEPEQDSLLNSLNINKDELIALIQADCIRIILPSSLNLANLKILERIANECPPNSMLLSRQLSGLTIMESRRRMPLLYPPLSVRERQQLLNEILSVAKKVKDKKMSDFLTAMQITLSNIWAIEHRVLNKLGAMAIGTLGFGRLCGDTLHSMSMVDRRFELYDSSFAIEFAGALGASVISGKNNNYFQYMEILASIYSGVPGCSSADFSSKLEVVMEGLLGIDNKMPIVDLAHSLKEDVDIESLRKIINGISNNDSNDLPVIISRFNEAIKKFERNSNRLRKLDIKGLKEFAIAASGLIEEKLPVYLTLGNWIMNVVANHLPNHSILNNIYDSMKGMATLSHPDVVLVSRFRDKILSLKD